MPRAEVLSNDDRIRVLFVQTKRQPTLDADTWIHLQILRELDRSKVRVFAACAPGTASNPTPTYQQLIQLVDVEIVKVDLGPERTGDSFAAKARAGLGVVPAVVSLVKLARYIRTHGIEVIHTSDRPRDAAACVILSRMTKAKCIVHAHVGFSPSWMGRTLQRAIRNADALIAISEFVARTLREAGCEPTSIHVVLNGIQPERWEPGRGRARTREQLGISDSTPVVLTVCRLFRHKGVGSLVQALHDVTGDVPNAVLLIAGQEMEPGYVEELAEMVREYDLDDRVRFLGRREDVPELMAAADVFAMPSEYEPFGLVYAEAMAMTLPVVALDNGGTVEVVEDGVTGLLSPLGDADALADNLRTLLLDPAKRAEYGRKGRERVQDQFTTRRMADDTADVYRVVARG